MNKSTYLKDAEVKKFALWLGANLDNATLAHTWTDRRTGAPWSCRSAFDAFQQYAWRFPSLPLQGIASGTSFAASAAALASLRTALLNAVSDSDAQQAAAAVMLWGGVGPGNIRWLQVNAAGLLAMLKATAHAITSNNLLHPILTARSLRFNAGMSKVYSLAVPGMIIYDSRVAAALAL